MTGSCPQEHESLPCGVDTHYIQLYLLSANHSIKCFFLVVVVALSQTNILQKLLLVPRANSVFWFYFEQIVSLPIAGKMARTRWRCWYCTILNVVLKQVKSRIMLIKDSDLNLKALSNIIFFLFAFWKARLRVSVFHNLLFIMLCLTTCYTAL